MYKPYPPPLNPDPTLPSAPIPGIPGPATWATATDLPAPGVPSPSTPISLLPQGNPPNGGEWAAFVQNGDTVKLQLNQTVMGGLTPNPGGGVLVSGALPHWLPAGPAGLFLQSQGPGLDPAWSTFGVVGQAVSMEQKTITTTNVIPPMNQTPSSAVFELIVNGRTFTLVDPEPSFTITGNVVTWVNSNYSLNPGDDVIAIYTWVGSASVGYLPLNGGTINGNLTVTGTLSLQNVSSFVLPGGASGYVLTTNGTGGLYWHAPSLGPAGPVGPAGAAGATGAAGPQGPAGPTGNPGPQGVTGPQGIPGATGAVGPIGPQGPAGATGATGAQGPAGPQGISGQTAVIVGQFGASKTPANLPPSGVIPANWDAAGVPPAQLTMQDGQALYYTVNGHVWAFVGTSMVSAGWIDLGGAQGPAGPAGPTGPQGAAGATGPQGPAGPTAVSANAGNYATLGTDSLIFVPTPPAPPTPASAAPLMDGTAAIGTSLLYARQDHVHPTDTSRYAASNPSGYVTSAGAASAAPVQSVAGRTGAVTLTHTDITDWTASLAPYALLASPALTGTPTAPTAAVSTNTTQLATTAFVLGQAATVAPLMDGAAAVGTSLLYARQDHVHPTDTSLAPIANPTFTGTPAAPTPPTANSSTRLATTAYVQANLTGGYLPLTGGTLTGQLYAPNVAVNYAAPAFQWRPTGGTQGTDAKNWDIIDENSTGNLDLRSINDAYTASVTVESWIRGASYTNVTKSVNVVETHTASVSVAMASPILSLNKTASGQANTVFGQLNGLNRWGVQIADGNAESTGDAGSYLSFQSYHDNGSISATPLYIRRDNSVATFQVAIVNGPSDRRLKENITPITGALAKVMALQGVGFNLIATPDKREIGLIAQDVEPIVPEIIQEFGAPHHVAPEASTPFMSLDYPKLTALLIEAIKELKGQLDALTAAQPPGQRP